MKEMAIIKKAQLIWIALTASCFIYGLALFLMIDMKIEGSFEYNIIHVVISIYSFLLFLATSLIRIKFLNLEYLINKFKKTDSSIEIEKLLNHMLTMNIVSWVLMDSIVINGMIISKLTSDFRPYLIFLTLGVVLLLKTKPNFHEVLVQLQNKL